MGITDISSDYAWSTHQPMIRMALKVFKPGFILELGIGKYSTPIFLKESCDKIFIENDQAWIKEMNIPGVIYHKVSTANQDIPISAITEDQRKSIIDFYQKFGNWIWEKDKPRLMFVDSYSCCRAISINVLYPAFDVIIYHDCQPGAREFNDYYFSEVIKDQFDIYNLSNPKTWTGLLVRKPSDEKLMINEIQPLIDEYMTENNIPEMKFFKTVHYDKV